MAPLPQRSRTVDAIYRMFEKRRADEDERTYLGFSTIGEECARQLWYGFRWAAEPEPLEGRKVRLFETGHLEEARLIRDLRAAGLTVFTIDRDTHRQFEVEAAWGHAKGHVDGVAIDVPEAPQSAHVLECKTHNIKSFKDLVKRGVMLSKPTHYAQVQAYMRLMGIKRCLYVAVSKETDEIHSQRIELDKAFAKRLIEKAERIVSTDVAPPKAFEDPKDKMAFPCGWCPALGICHHGEFARVNCRTCLHAVVMQGGKWWCDHHHKELSVADQKAGCRAHLYLPSLVPGTQVDVVENADGAAVVYQLANGETFTNTGAK